LAGVTDLGGRPPAGPSSKVDPVGRPEDVDTGFWLWLLALPLMVIGYVVDLVVVHVDGPAVVVYGTSAVLLVVVSSVVLTFLLLMRKGYRWTRTVLSGGGAATIAYSVTNLFEVQRPGVAALVYAATAIVGSVCIAGGVYLLHRKDAYAFFTR
jgi:hypothetical protein